jgi:cell division protease FtsH
MALEGEGGRTLFGRGVGDKDYSEKVGAEIDSEVSKIMSEALKRAQDVLKEHKKAFDAVAKKLVEVETLERADYEKILIANGIVPEKKGTIVDEKKVIID